MNNKIKQLVTKLKYARKIVSWKLVEEVVEILMEINNDKPNEHKSSETKKPI